MAVVNAETHKRKFSENKPPPQGSGNIREERTKSGEERKKWGGALRKLVAAAHVNSEQLGYLYKICTKRNQLKFQHGVGERES